MTPLYHRIIEHSKASFAGEVLTRKMWDNTPWVADVYFGRYGTERVLMDHKIRIWCTEHFGKEAWPIHDKPGNWCRGGATGDGWGWIGFHTEEMMLQFLLHMPNPPWLTPGPTP